jgi:hypothetical protein
VEKCIYGFGVGNLRERGYLIDLGINERVILKLTFKKGDGTWSGLIWLRIRKSFGFL